MKRYVCPFAAVLFFTSLVSAIGVQGGDLVHHLKFENNIDDEMNNSKPLLYGPKFIEGVVDRALQFNGGGDYMRIFQPFFEKHNAFSVSLWIKPKGKTPDIQMILWQGKGDGGDSATQDEARLNLNEEGDEVIFRMTTTGHPLLVNGSVKKNEWNHVVVIVKNTQYQNFSADLYINGNFTRHHELNQSMLLMEYNKTLFIGKPEANSRYFKGSLDEIRFYKTYLSEKEIAELYQEGIRCSTNDECGSETETRFCEGKELCLNTTLPYCANPGSPDSSCGVVSKVLCNECNNSCLNETCMLVEIMPEEKNTTTTQNDSRENTGSFSEKLAQQQNQSEGPSFWKKIKCRVFHPLSRERYNSCIK